MKRTAFAALLIAITSLTTALTGCNSSDSGAGNPAATDGARPTSLPDGSTPSKPAPDAATQGRIQSYQTDALVFAGTGVWSSELTSLLSLLSSHGLTYQQATQAQLNAMTVDDIAQFGMIVWPGGSGTSQMSGLDTQARENLRIAVQERGVSWIGFCAGAFAAVTPLDVVAGPTLDYYYLENQGVSYAMVNTTWADGSTHDLLWYGGPVTPAGAGEVLARYPDGNAAASQIWSGRGFVIITGPHPGVPSTIASSLGLTDSDGSDLELTWTLLNATLQQKPLPVF